MVTIHQHFLSVFLQILILFLNHCLFVLFCLFDFFSSKYCVVAIKYNFFFLLTICSQ
uniref:Uncharacterized protein n=1 Tax=Octopus bimaculoides TaxID=37653 RepID=A0A0L8H8L2_OCTBM